MKNPERQAVMMNGYQSFSFGNSICSPVLSAVSEFSKPLCTKGFQKIRKVPNHIILFN